MKKYVTIILVCSFALYYWTTNQFQFQNGDIIFQISKSAQSEAIQLATHSQYSHVGVIYQTEGKYYVYEAIQPVSLTPLDEWIKRGEHGKFVVKRLKNADKVLTAENLYKMKKVSEEYAGKDYDIFFGWSDDSLYCSELVWKIYNRALGVEIGELKTLKDFDLSDPIVKLKLKERYSNNIPMNELVISPGDMFNSDLLDTIYAN